MEFQPPRNVGEQSRIWNSRFSATGRRGRLHLPTLTAGSRAVRTEPEEPDLTNRREGDREDAAVYAHAMSDVIPRPGHVVRALENKAGLSPPDKHVVSLLPYAH